MQKIQFTKRPTLSINVLGKHFLVRDLIRNRQVYLMAIPIILYYTLFHYLPMYGAIIAFKDFSPGKGILGSEWVGLDNFMRFYNSIYFWRVIRNTLKISIANIIFGFPAPIILALLFNELRNVYFKRVAQTISYLPHFISIMVVSGIILDFTSMDGIVNDIIAFLGGERIPIMLRPELFVPVYIITEIWQTVGWGSIIYIAALSGIDQELYEAARIDGAGRWKQTLHITIPCLMPTVIIMLILRLGQIMNVGFEKIILLSNSITAETAEVISSFVYKRGLLEFDYSFSAAVGLFNSVINFSMLVLANWISKKVSDSSLW